MDYRLGVVQRYLLFFVGLSMLLFCTAVALKGGLNGVGGVPVPPVIKTMAICFGAILGGAAIWRSFSQSAVVSTEQPPAVERIDHSRDVLQVRFLLRHGYAQLILDEEERRVHFFNCHVPFGLLTSAAEEFSCPVDSIVRVHDARVANLGQCLTIVTLAGRCVVPRGDDNFPSLVQRLKVLAPDNHPGFVFHDPRMQYPIGVAISGCGVLGLLAGCWMVPMGANDTTLYLFGGLVAAFGIGASMFGVWSLDLSLQAIHADRIRTERFDALESPSRGN